MPALRVTGRAAKTNVVSNTAFRGFGGPQGIIAAERWIDSHLAEPVTVAGLADALAISPKTLSRRISAATGVWIARFETDPNARSSRQVEVVCGGAPSHG